MNQSIGGTDTILVMDDKMHIGYIMSFVLHQKKVGDITIELDLINDGVVLTVCTMKGFVEKAKSSTSLFKSDLSIEVWKSVISNLLQEHHFSQQHIEFLNSVSKDLILKPNNSGCMLFFTMILFIFGYLLIT